MKLHYRDFNSYEELMREPSLARKLVYAYQATFSGSEVWGETYSDEDVHRKLKAELSGHASLRMCVDLHTVEVAAFFWAQLCTPEEILRAIGTIKFSASMATPALLADLRNAIGEREVIYVHDLGILEPYRGRIWMTHLTGPVLHEVAEESGNGRVLFWSVPGTQVAALARRTGFREVLVTNGMHFHLGEFTTGRGGDGVNLPWMNRGPSLGSRLGGRTEMA